MLYSSVSFVFVGLADDYSFHPCFTSRSTGKEPDIEFYIEGFAFTKIAILNSAQRDEISPSPEFYICLMGIHVGEITAEEYNTRIDGGGKAANFDLHLPVVQLRVPVGQVVAEGYSYNNLIRVVVVKGPLALLSILVWYRYAYPLGEKYHLGEYGYLRSSCGKIGSSHYIL